MSSISLVSLRARSRVLGPRAQIALSAVLLAVLVGVGAPARAQDAPDRAAAAPLAPRAKEPTFDGEATRKRVPNLPLLATGTVVLAAAYVPSVIGAAASQRTGDNKLYIPVAGPFLALNRGAPEKPGYKTLFVADGVAQSLGGLGALMSVMIPERITQRWYLIGKGESFHVAPGRIAGGYGLRATGNF